MADMEPERRFNEFERFDQFVEADTVAAADPLVPSALTAHDLTRFERFESALSDIKHTVGQAKSTGELTRLTQQRQEGAMQQIFAALQMLTGKVDALGNELARDRAERALEKDGHAPRIPDLFDAAIEIAAKQYTPEVDWRLYKAQLFQESKMDPQARSSAGAMGIAQFMPATWRETCTLLRYPPEASAFDVRFAIPAGAHYMRRMRRLWGKTEIQPEDRHRFALASYNAGGGNIQKAWRLAGKPGHWWPVEEHLPEITGKHAAETITYVARVYRWYEQLTKGA